MCVVCAYGKDKQYTHKSKIWIKQNTNIRNSVKV